MKKNIIITIIVIVSAGLIGLVVRQARLTASRSALKAATSHSEIQSTANLRQATMKISGMFCTSCATGIEYSLKGKPGVVSATVDYNSKIGQVVYNPAQISKVEIIQAVKPYIAVITNDQSFK